MQLSEAQDICMLLREDGYHAWVVEGYSIHILLRGELLELKKSERSSYR